MIAKSIINALIVIEMNFIFVLKTETINNNAINCFSCMSMTRTCALYSNRFVPYAVNHKSNVSVCDGESSISLCFATNSQFHVRL